METVLKTNNLTKSYGKQKALDKVSINVNRGAIYGLIGRNGAGKTTLMRMISGLASADSGSFELYSKGGSVNSKGIKIGCLIENTGIYPNMTAKDNLELKAFAFGIKEKGEIKRILKMVGLEDVGRKKVKNFSMGMKQRLGIGLAMVGSPKIIILDEPINGLDPQGIVEVRDIIKKLNEELGITFIISSHILEELSKIATNFGIIDQGMLLTEITKEELMTKNREHIELTTPDSKVSETILNELEIEDYEIISDSTIRIFGAMNRTGDIALALAKKEIPIEYLTVNKNSLEDYYLKLTGYSKAN
ncbi:MAG: ATP-binding cassette domain-containing protein [Peptoniphilus sp.]|nr:ATP-binding cassette domain-containing protein [Peptoniphilus sp.]